MNINPPKISCICITNNRSSLLQKAIKCFDEQDYANKELVISYPKDDKNTKAIIQQLLSEGRFDILAIERPETELLGNARNDAIHKCRGTYVCIWDDDDWHHPTRLSYQINSLQTTGKKYEASILYRIFLYDYTTKLAYLSFPYHWDGTLLCRKEMLMHNQYADKNKGEDSQIVPFMEKKGMLAHIDESPYLYIYTYHGNNTWPYDHFMYFIGKSILLNDEYNSHVNNLINN